MKQNIIKIKSMEFALQSIQLYKLLVKNDEYILSKQFIRSSTSIGANVNEADAGYSKKDFSAKMSIASKEARETMYWLMLLESSNFVDFNYSKIKNDCEELIKILTSIVKTSQLSLSNRN